MKIIAIGIALAALSHTARADQCEWIDQATAQRAVEALANHPSVAMMCEPCGDKAPGAPAVAGKVAIHELRDNGYAVSIDGRDIDLAYAYVQTSHDRYTNLAYLAQCAATGVSRNLHIHGETRDGVLLYADSDLAPAPAAPVPAPAAPAPVIVNSPPPQVVVSSPAPQVVLEAPSVWPAALAGGATASLLIGVGLIAATRRRRLMEPRAVRLRAPERDA